MDCINVHHHTYKMDILHNLTGNCHGAFFLLLFFPHGKSVCVVGEWGENERERKREFTYNFY